MKKAKILLGILSIVLIGFITSCTDEEAVPPTLTLDGSGSYIAADAPLEAGADFSVSITALKGDANLTSFKAERIMNNTPVVILDSTLTNDSKDQFVLVLALEASLTIGEENFVFTITDKDGETTEKSFIITTTRTPEAIDSYTAVIMGAQSATPGSFLDVETGTVINMAQKDANQDVIDVVFYYGSSSGNQCTFVAPTHSTVTGPIGNTNDGLFEYCTNWETKNATKFKSGIGITVAQFDEITNDAKIFEIADIDAEILTNLQVDDIAAIETEDGKKGVFKVVSITGDAGASVITIDVKIQQ